MKSTFFSIFALALTAYTSCERKPDKPAPERLSPEISALEERGHGKSNEALPRVPEAGSSGNREELPPPIASPATLNRIFKEAEEAFTVKDYSKAVANYEELLKILGPHSELPREMLYFQIGLGRLLGGKYPEAATAFKDCIQQFPEGEYTSRAYLGLGRACMMQNLPEKNEEALGALKKAAADPKYKPEADLWISRISQSPSDP